MDPLDWVHQWDNYEMVMYVRNDDGEQGIFMQVLEKHLQDGAEEWNIVYDRQIADLDPNVPGEPGSEAWEEKQLREHLNRNPQLVTEEKNYLKSYLGGAPGTNETNEANGTNETNEANGTNKADE